jgi:hypothetical protein
MRQILVEYLPFTYSASTITESSKSSGKFIVEGVLQRAGSKNQNGRIYPKAILEREVAKYQDTEIKERRALGELDHPESSVVNLKNVSHNILKVRWQGDDVYGTIEILDTPSGNILKSLFKSGVTLGISSRGLGSVKQLDETTVEVQDDFQLLCWDFVSNPSTQGAFMSPIGAHGYGGIGNSVYESVNHSTGGVQILSEIDQLIHEIICDLSGVCCVDVKKSKQ